MTISHHPDHSTLVAYATGDLNTSASLLVATHLAMCPECRAAVRDAESIGGALLETLKPEPVGQGAFEAVMARLAESNDASSESEAGHDVRAADAPDDGYIDGIQIPNPLRAYLGDAKRDGLPWQRLSAGIERLDVLDGPDVVARMLRIEPGRAVPRHGHDGDELTLILAGDYSDEFGRFGPGDVADLDGDIIHRPIAGSREPCVCLIAADAPVRLVGPFGKLLQPFVRF